MLQNLAPGPEPERGVRTQGRRLLNRGGVDEVVVLRLRHLVARDRVPLRVRVDAVRNGRVAPQDPFPDRTGGRRGQDRWVLDVPVEAVRETVRVPKDLPRFRLVLSWELPHTNDQ